MGVKFAAPPDRPKHDKGAREQLKWSTSFSLGVRRIELHPIRSSPSRIRYSPSRKTRFTTSRPRDSTKSTRKSGDCSSIRPPQVICANTPSLSVLKNSEYSASVKGGRPILSKALLSPLRRLDKSMYDATWRCTSFSPSSVLVLMFLRIGTVKNSNDKSPTVYNEFRNSGDFVAPTAMAYPGSGSGIDCRKLAFVECERHVRVPFLNSPLRSPVVPAAAGRTRLPRAPTSSRR